MTAPVNGKRDALHTDYMTLAPAESIFDKATSETRANSVRGEFLANQQVQQAFNHRYARQIAQGLGFLSVTDALAKLAAILAAEPIAYVRADALEALKAAPDGIGASLFTAPLAGRVGIYLAAAKGGAE